MSLHTLIFGRKYPPATYGDLEVDCQGNMRGLLHHGAKSKPLTGCGDSVFRTNAFLLCIHGCLVSLFGMSLISSQWYGDQGIPKTAELPIYAGFMCAAVVWFLFARYIQHTLRKNVPFFWVLLSLYLPTIAIVNALPNVSKQSTMILFWSGLTIALLWLIESLLASTQKKSIALCMLIMGLATATVLTIVLSVGNTFSISLTTLVIFGVVWLLLEKGRLRVSDSIFTFGVALLLTIPIFLVIPGPTNVHHYSYLLGPIIETLYGRHPLVDIAPQYGSGMTVALAWYFRFVGHVSNDGLLVLLKFLTYCQFLLFFVIGWSLYRSRSLAVFALLSALVFAYFSQGDQYFSYPSTGFLRFGFPMIIAGLYCIPSETFAKRYRSHLVAFIAAIASFWSFESMIYTLPAVCAAEWTAHRLRTFAPLLFIYIIAVGSAYLLPLIFSGHMPDLAQYIEYPFIYVNGFGQILLERHTTLWWLLIPIALWGVAQSIWDELPDSRIALLSVYALAIFTYFGGRAHPNNVHHISLPFILLLFFYVSKISYRTWRHAVAAMAVSVILSINMSDFSSGPVLKSMLASLRASWNTTPPVLDDCGPYSDFRHYVRSGKIALLDASDSAYMIHACISAANAFAINPYSQTALSPLAIARAIGMARTLPKQPVLVATDTESSSLASAILQQMTLGQGQTVIIGNREYKLYD